METKRLNSSCLMKDHEDITIESQRTRRTKNQTDKDHIADRGLALVLHGNMVHLWIPILIFPDAKAALDKGWDGEHAVTSD